MKNRQEEAIKEREMQLARKNREELNSLKREEEKKIKAKQKQKQQIKALSFNPDEDEEDGEEEEEVVEEEKNPEKKSPSQVGLIISLQDKLRRVSCTDMTLTVYFA